MKRFLLITIFILIGSNVFPQDDYEAWLKKEKEKYKTFLEEEDKKFIEFLKKEWKQFDVLKGQLPFDKPKPKTPPIYKPEPEKIEKPIEIKAELNKIVEPPAVVKVEKPQVKPVVEIPPATSKPTAKEIAMQFYDVEVKYSEEEKFQVPILNSISKEAVAEYWEKLSTQPYKNYLARLQNEKKRLNLNDWGYSKMLFNFAKEQSSNKRNESYLLTWFMLVKSGYAARIGYEKNKIFLLIPTANKLFGVPYFTFSGMKERFYILLFDGETMQEGAMTTYKEDYPSAKNVFDFNVSSLPQIGKKFTQKEFKFSYGDKEFTLPIEYNKSLIDYFEFYPYTDMAIYFRAELSEKPKSELLPKLKELIKGKDEKDAVGFLLNFVQYATGYKTDDDNFGREKPLFPDESVFYDYTDCEDRSILFAYLVRNLVGLEVIGLDYPDHIATAVRFNSDVNGDAIKFDGKIYTICDPTYIGAGIGKCMPDYKTTNPDVIVF